MQLPPGERGPAAAPSNRPTGTPSTRRSGDAPKLASRRTPTTSPPTAIRLAVPIPPFQSKHTMPVPAPTAPWSTTLEAAAAASARPASAASTWTTRVSFSQLSSHSATTGITTSSTPTAGSTSTAAATAPSYTRPTDIVAVR